VKYGDRCECGDCAALEAASQNLQKANYKRAQMQHPDVDNTEATNTCVITRNGTRCLIDGQWEVVSPEVDHGNGNAGAAEDGTTEETCRITRSGRECLVSGRWHYSPLKPKKAQPAGAAARAHSATLLDERKGAYFNSKGELVEDPLAEHAAAVAAAAAAAAVAAAAASSKKSASSDAGIKAAMMAQAEGLLAKRMADTEALKKEFSITRAETEARVFAKQHNMEL
jgi:hypothetical protein